MNDTSNQTTPNRFLGGLHLLFQLMSQSIVLTGVVVAVAMWWLYFASAWPGFNFLLALPFAYYGLRGLYRRLRSTRTKKAALGYTILVGLVGWVSLDLIDTIIRPSLGLASLTGFFPLGIFYNLLDAVTGYHFYFGA